MFMDFGLSAGRGTGAKRIMRFTGVGRDRPYVGPSKLGLVQLVLTYLGSISDECH